MHDLVVTVKCCMVCKNYTCYNEISVLPVQGNTITSLKRYWCSFGASKSDSGAGLIKERYVPQNGLCPFFEYIGEDPEMPEGFGKNTLEAILSGLISRTKDEKQKFLEDALRCMVSDAYFEDAYKERKWKKPK